MKINNNVFTNLLIIKTNNIIKNIEIFDNIFKSLLEKETINETSIARNIAELTEKFIFIRSEHASLILLLDELKKNILLDTTTEKITDQIINEQYTLSTFYSILQDISAVINNVDFQYKKIALKFPKFINKKTLSLILVINTEDPNKKNIEKCNKFKEIFNQLQKSNPENSYIIFENQKVINLKEIMNKDVELNVTKNPSLFMINNEIITEISLKENDTFERISKMIS